MSKRDFYKELSYSQYFDMEEGNHTETICYPSLICIIGELCNRIEELEARLNELDPPVNDIYRRTYELDGPTGLIGDPQ